MNANALPGSPGLDILRDENGLWRLRAGLLLDDRPGQLSMVADLAAARQANIFRFSYNRSQDPFLVSLEAFLPLAAVAGALADDFLAAGCLTPRTMNGTRRPAEPGITEVAGLLKIKTALEDRPGTLAAFARVLKRRGANVIHMDYDGQAAPGLAEVDMSVRGPDEVRELLAELTAEGFAFHVAWLGAEGGPIDAVVGLSQVETFLFKLKALLPPESLAALRELLLASQDMRRALADFKSRSGESEQSLAAAEAFTDILHFAAASLTRTGSAFIPRLSGPVRLSGTVSAWQFACPSGANAYLLEAGSELVLFDSGYGVHYPDARDWLAGRGLSPQRVSRAFFTHADADHAGFAAPLCEEFATRLFFHPDCREVFDNEDRAHGAGSGLAALNRSFTRLVNRITGLRAPRAIEAFEPPRSGTGAVAGFPVIGRFAVGDLEFLVLESLGGHVTGCVFYYCPGAGLLVSGDYLIDFASLTDREKAVLSVPKRLMTSTNKDSRVFSGEMDALRRLLLQSEDRAMVLPGHGAMYAVRDMAWGRTDGA